MLQPGLVKKSLNLLPPLLSPGRQQLQGSLRPDDCQRVLRPDVWPERRLTGQIQDSSLRSYRHSSRHPKPLTGDISCLSLCLYGMMVYIKTKRAGLSNMERTSLLPERRDSTESSLCNEHQLPPAQPGRGRHPGYQAPAQLYWVQSREHNVS